MGRGTRAVGVWQSRRNLGRRNTHSQGRRRNRRRRGPRSTRSQERRKSAPPWAAEHTQSGAPESAPPWAAEHTQSGSPESRRRGPRSTRSQRPPNRHLPSLIARAGAGNAACVGELEIAFTNNTSADSAAANGTSAPSASTAAAASRADRSVCCRSDTRHCVRGEIRFRGPRSRGASLGPTRDYCRPGRAASRGAGGPRRTAGDGARRRGAARPASQHLRRSQHRPLSLEQQLGSIDFNLGELSRTVTRLKEQLRNLEIETEAQILHRHEDESTHRGDFDPLELDRYSSIQQFSRALAETANDVGSIQQLLENLGKETQNLLQQQARTITELQNGLMRTRMVPFQRHVQRLARIVRQAANDTGKRADLTVEGASGELDRQVLERMLPPFEHMLRNAVVHGIENPASALQPASPTRAASFSSCIVKAPKSWSG